MTFVHRTFQEYLAARFLIDGTDDIRDFFGDPKADPHRDRIWELACAMASDASDLLKAKTTDAQPMVLQSAAWLASAFGQDLTASREAVNHGCRVIQHALELHAGSMHDVPLAQLRKYEDSEDAFWAIAIDSALTSKILLAKVLVGIHKARLGTAAIPLKETLDQSHHAIVRRIGRSMQFEGQCRILRRPAHISWLIYDPPTGTASRPVLNFTSSTSSAMAAALSSDDPTTTHRSADVVILTALATETYAVQQELLRMRDYRVVKEQGKPPVGEAWLPTASGRPVRVASVPVVMPGSDGIATSLHYLKAKYDPAVMLLVGVAAGNGEQMRSGDVVVADQVHSYDLQRDTTGPAYARSTTRIGGLLSYRLNDFLTRVPAEQSGPDGERFHIHRGPVGSFNVVSGPRQDLWSAAQSSKRMLAVSMEAAGLINAIYSQNASLDGWLAILGVVDVADGSKQHGFDLAARHAAQVVALLAPHVAFD